MPTIHEMTDEEFLQHVATKAFDAVTSAEFYKLWTLASSAAAYKEDLKRERVAAAVNSEALKQAIEERDQARKAAQ